jgi:leader peptidase (prepilin peptidase)/N-methyltransferase
MLVGVATVVALLYAFYVLLLPEWELQYFRWRYPKKILPAELGMQWSSRNFLRTCEFFFYAWFFYFGASIASFLNVVAWRTPQGRTIVFGGSKCPYCNTRLHFLDNTPVLGWLLVKGRCRTCKLPIAPRYLWIEVIIGGIFVWLAFWELIRGGANLPHWSSDGKSGLTSMVFDPQWLLITAWLVHAMLFAFVVMLAVVNEVRLPFPWLPFLVIVGLLAGPSLVQPKLFFVGWSEPFIAPSSLGISPLTNRAVSILIGVASGWLGGWFSAWCVASRQDRFVRRHWILQSILVGAVLGWQAAVTILLVSLILIKVAQTFGWFTTNEKQRTSAIPHLGANACFVAVCLTHHSMWLQVARLMGIV